mgnify:CR=1 FL=1
MTNISIISENDNSTVLTEYKGLTINSVSRQSEDDLEKWIVKHALDEKK